MIDQLPIMMLLVLANAAWIMGMYWVCWFDWRGDSPMAVTRKNARVVDILPGSKMAFWFIRFWVFKLVGKRFGKPIILCTTCMSSIHSTYFYFIFNRNNILFDLESAWMYIVYVGMLAGTLAFMGYFSNE